MQDLSKTVRGITLYLFFPIFLLGFFAPSAQAELLAAAASLRPILEQASQLFEKEKEIKVELIFGTSGKLALQIEMGAPFSLYLSADEHWTRHLEAKGLLENVRPVAETSLVLWWNSDIAPSLDLVEGKNYLIAVADPDTAPFGALALEYLEKTGILEQLKVKDRLIISGDVLKAALTAKYGFSTAALIPLSIAKMMEGSWTRTPMAPQRIFCGIVKKRGSDTSLEFIEFLFSPKVQELFKEAGFEILS